MSQQQKLSPQVLRLLVIMPNAMNYMLAFGIGMYIVTNLEEMKAQGALTFWIISFLVIFGVGLLTSLSIFKKIKAGQM